MSSSPTPSERFDEIEALLRTREGDAGPDCVEFRRGLTERQPEEGLNAEQRAHVSGCEGCAALAASWRQLPDRLGAAFGAAGILGKGIVGKGIVDEGIGSASPLSESMPESMPGRFEDLPWLQAPERLAAAGLVPSDLDSRIEAALAGAQLSAPAELDSRVEQALRQTGKAEARRDRDSVPVLSFGWRAAAAAAVLLVSALLVWQQRGDGSPEIELVLVEKPFDLRFDGAEGTLPGPGARQHDGDRKGEEEDE